VVARTFVAIAMCVLPSRLFAIFILSSIISIVFFIFDLSCALKTSSIGTNGPETAASGEKLHLLVLAKTNREYIPAKTAWHQPIKWVAPTARDPPVPPDGVGWKHRSGHAREMIHCPMLPCGNRPISVRRFVDGAKGPVLSVAGQRI
jgi:hypothetical protein